MCSSPIDDHIAVTVKQVEGGKVSAIQHKLKAGQTVDVMQPEGASSPSWTRTSERTNTSLAPAGGITPDVDHSDRPGKSHKVRFLLYGNRDENPLFFHRLEELLQRYSNQLIVEHILNQPTGRRRAACWEFLKKGHQLGGACQGIWG